MGKQPIPTTGLSPASPMAFWAAEHSLSPRSPHGIADPIVLESEKQDLERSSFWRPPMAHHVGEIEHSDVTRCHDVLRERFRVFRHSQRIPVLEMSACDPVNRPDGTLNAIPGRQSASHTILGPQISFRLEKQNTKSEGQTPRSRRHREAAVQAQLIPQFLGFLLVLVQPGGRVEEPAQDRQDPPARLGDCRADDPVQCPVA